MRPGVTGRGGAEQAKTDGSWYADREEPEHPPARHRGRRFLVGFLGTLVLSFLVRFVFDALTGRDRLFSTDELIDAAIAGIFPGLMTGSFLTMPRRPRRPSRS